MPQFLGNLDLDRNELQNTVIQNLAAAPSNPQPGLVYYDTTKEQFGVATGDSSWTYVGDIDGVITAINASAPLASTGGTTPTLSISDATPSARGAMTAADKTKLNGVASGATANQTDAHLLSRANHTGTQAISTVTGLQTALDGKLGTAVATPSTNGAMSAADKTKLDGVATGATANSTDAQLRDRATHTGTQAIASVTGLQAALDGKLGTAVATTSADGAMSSTDKAKLDGIAAGATANSTDAQLRARSSHTGTQAISTVSGLQAELDGKASTAALSSKADLVNGKVPDSQIPPLAITETFEVASQSAMLALTAQEGDVAIRTDVSKTFILAASPASALANWKELRSPTDGVQSVSGSAPITSSGGSSPSIGITDATTVARGAMTSADKVKLNGIATGATANATDAQLRDRSTHTGSQAIGTVTGLQAALDGKLGTAVATPSTNGAMSSTDKSKLDGISAGATANSTDAHLLSRANHTGSQAISTVSGLQAALDGKLGTAVATTSSNGAMSSEDKTKLDGIAAGATANIGTVRKAVANVGNGSATSFTVTHNFNTRDVTVEVHRNSTPWDTVFVDVERSTVNAIVVRFAVAPASNAFRVVVTG